MVLKGVQGSSNDDEKPFVVIGLDVSTSVVGFAALDENGKLIELDSVKLSKFSNIWKKSAAVDAFLKQKFSLYNVKDVFVEQALSRFRPGASSAQTLMTLSRFNGIVSYLSHKIFAVDPKYVDFSVARRHLGIKVISMKKCNVEPKIQIMDQVTKKVFWNFKEKTLASGPRKGQTIIDPCSYDECDAWVTARAGLDGIIVIPKKKKVKLKTK